MVFTGFSERSVPQGCRYEARIENGSQFRGNTKIIRVYHAVCVQEFAKRHIIIAHQNRYDLALIPENLTIPIRENKYRYQLGAKIDSIDAHKHLSQPLLPPLLFSPRKVRTYVAYGLDEVSGLLTLLVKC